MKLDKLSKTIESSKKRLGRGHGSGRGGHTSSRGAKGDKARGKTKLLFEGVKTKKSLIKRLPFSRGKDKLRPSKGPSIINLSRLSVYQENEPVTFESLHKKGLINRRSSSVKVLGMGELKKPLKVYLTCSSSATKKIHQAGGEVLATAESTGMGQ